MASEEEIRVTSCIEGRKSAQLTTKKATKATSLISGDCKSVQRCCGGDGWVDEGNSVLGAARFDALRGGTAGGKTAQCRHGDVGGGK